MNQYGTTAQKHWQRWLPNRYNQIEDPDSFFSALGKEIANAISDLQLELAGDDPGGETYLEKLGRLNSARLDAESTVMREMALLEPETKANLEQQQTTEE